MCWWSVSNLRQIDAAHSNNIQAQQSKATQLRERKLMKFASVIAGAWNSNIENINARNLWETLQLQGSIKTKLRVYSDETSSDMAFIQR